MSENTETARRSPSIHGLQGTWAVVVQLVGTFGLAVFLVLYYVLVMQPREQGRYDQLRESVNALVQIVEDGQSLVTQEQSDRLEELYVLAVAPELADRAERLLPGDTAPQAVSAADAQRLQAELRVTLEELMLVRTRLLRGLSRKEGGALSETLKKKIRDGRVADQLAKRIVVEWPYRSREDLVSTCKESLDFAFRRLAMTK